MAFDMPLYMAPGEGLMIWILVLSGVSTALVLGQKPARRGRTLRRSTGYITECSYCDVSTSVCACGEVGDVRRCLRTRLRACSQ